MSDQKKSGWVAIGDLGTNTFHLLVAKMEHGKIVVGLRKKIGVKIGKGSMENREISTSAIQRAIVALNSFGEEIKPFGLAPSDCNTLGTSAFRNAENRNEVLDFIRTETGFNVRILSGDEEANMIFNGVCRSGAILEQKTNLLIDIGGGSVEFILSKGLTQIWRQSFEIGGQRLIEKFHHSDPISQIEIFELQSFIKIELAALFLEMANWKPEVLVGCSGAFDTLVELEQGLKGIILPDVESSPFYNLSIEAFQILKEKIIRSSLSERLKMKGMIPLRAEMIVVAVLLIECVLNKMVNPQIRTSTFALKEGYFFEYHENQS